VRHLGWKFLRGAWVLAGKPADRPLIKLREPRELQNLDLPKASFDVGKRTAGYVEMLGDVFLLEPDIFASLAETFA
jgi:hypothetical protein